MKTSIIIPTLNEAQNIGRLLTRLKQAGANFEIIVVDAGSQDDTVAIAKRLGAKIIQSASPGRANQMNIGATHAQSDLLYFVHADVLPPLNFYQHIEAAVRAGFDCGCFRYQFDRPHFLLKINAYCTRFPWLFCRGGDQTLFIKKSIFKKEGGFKSDFIIMEDFEFIKMLQKKYTFKILPTEVIVSARKYAANSWLRVQLSNLIVFSMYRTGWFSQQKMFYTYKKLLRS